MTTTLETPPLETRSPAPPPAPPVPAGLRDPLPVDEPFRVAGGAASAEGRRLLEGRLARLVVGDVLVAHPAPDSLAARAAAVLLLLPAGRGKQVVGFGSAAWLYAGVAAVGRPPERLDVVIEPGRRRPSSPVIRVRQVPLPAAAVESVLGVPVTGPVRTAADVARDLPAEAALTALRRLGELTGVRPHQVLTELAAMRYARGAANGRRVVRRWAEER